MQMKLKLKHIILLSVFIIGIAKSYVFYIEKNVASLKKQVNARKKNINLLKVEWTYLNQNSRLQKLAKLCLPTWRPIEPKQMKDVQKIKAGFAHVEQIEKEERDRLEKEERERKQRKKYENKSIQNAQKKKQTLKEKNDQKTNIAEQKKQQQAKVSALNKGR